MSDSSSTGIVGIIAIFVMVIVVGFVAVRSGVLGGGTHKTVDINVETPATK